jgi:hypothetical protein
MGMRLGEAAAVDRTVEEGGLQLDLECWGESVGKVLPSLPWKPK